MSKRRHIWREATIKGKVHRWCEACGVDRTPTAEKAGCRPTRIAGL
jgi:hypothetical protein